MELIKDIDDILLRNMIQTSIDENMNGIASVSSLSSLAVHMKKSLQVIEDTLRLYSLESIAISFNGGKDATITLQLLRYVLAKQNLLPALGTKIPIIYFHDPQSFPEMVAFLDEMKQKYQLEYTIFHCSYKEGMKQLVDRGIKAILMGVRKGDPYSEDAEHMTPSSPTWPTFMRIYPLLNWKYSHVWTFIRSCHIPYCSLYDAGYTSIGLKHNTHRHESLRVVTPSSSEHSSDYLPAYHLSDVDDERVFRTENLPPFSATPNPVSLTLPSLLLYILIIYDTVGVKNRLSVILDQLHRQFPTERQLPIVLLRASPSGIPDLPSHLRIAQETLSARGTGGDVLIYGEFSSEYRSMSSLVLSSIYTTEERSARENHHLCEDSNWLEGTIRNITYLLVPTQDSSTRIESKIASFIENRSLCLTPPPPQI